MITLEIDVAALQAERGPEIWETRLFNALAAAGIPVAPDGTLKHGSIMRFNDPMSWSKVTYMWQPDASEHQTPGEHGG